MKNLTITLILALGILLLDCGNSSIDKSQMVNPVIGDISYEIKYGHKPNAATNNHLRVKTHLEYVENLLRQKDVSKLAPELQSKRKLLLDLFHDYWMKGVFPKNYDYADQRKPCFIDKDNNICAVGYLVEQTVSRQVANEINAKYKYDNVLAMNDERVDDWILTSGLTKKEFAMIQPTYGPPPPTPTPNDNYISRSYGISSSLMGGLNLSLNTINGIQISKGANNKMVPILGLIAGAGQITLGAFNYPNESLFSDVNPSKRNLSLVNIGLGTSTLILSSWNLIRNRKPKEKSLSWNVYSFPTQAGNMGLGLSFTKRL